MLVLSRKSGEEIVIDDRITVTVTRVSGNRVTLAIKAPDEVRILRGELQPIANSFREAAPASPSHGEHLSYAR